MRRQLLALLLLPLVISPAAAQPPEKEAWNRITTEHFVMMSNANPRDVARMASDMEGICGVLGRITPGATIRSPVPTWVFVFKDARSFNPYRLDPNGKPANISGYFQPGVDANFLCIEASAQAEAPRIAYHEFIHLLISNNFRNVPLWLNEGLADYYSTFEIDGNRVKIGRPIAEHVNWLQDHHLLPLQDLFAITTDSPDYHEGEAQGVFYAQSWALTPCLMTRGTAELGRPARLLAAFNRGLSLEQAVSASFELTPDELHDMLVDYVARTSFSVHAVTLSESAEEKQIQSRPMRRAEVLFHLGDLLAHRTEDQYAAAEEHLTKCLEVDGRNSGALVSLGYMAGMKDDEERATRYYEQALEADPTDWRAHYFEGLQALEMIQTAANTRQDVKPKVYEARGHFRQSLVTNPDFAPARASLGRTFLFDGDSTGEGLELVTQAVEEMPSHDELLFDLVLLTAMAGEPEEARRILDEELGSTGDAELVRQTETFLNSYQTFKRTSQDADLFSQGVDLLQRDQLDSAAFVVRALIESATDSTLKSEAIELGHDIDQRIAVRHFNEGVGAANSGDLLRAKRLFQEVLEMDVDAEMRDRATEVLGRIEGALKGK